MTLRFDKNKLHQPLPKSIFHGNNVVSTGFHFGYPSIDSAKTEIELTERISRVGGFDSERVDRETLKIILNF